MRLTIYHNPRCSKSRQTLTLLRERGESPEVIEYLTDPPDADTLRRILGLLGIGARQLLRTKEDAYRALNLSDPTLSEQQLIEAMVAHPALIERPIVVRDNAAARLGRPPENVLELLDR